MHAQPAHPRAPRVPLRAWSGWSIGVTIERHASHGGSRATNHVHGASGHPGSPTNGRDEPSQNRETCLAYYGEKTPVIQEPE